MGEETGLLDKVNQATVGMETSILRLVWVMFCVNGWF